MLHVTCAIIQHENKILICQRSAAMKLPLKWEFPGGKIEVGESLYPFLCTMSGGRLHAAEHAQAIWVDAAKLLNYDWAEADVPIVNELLKL